MTTPTDQPAAPAKRPYVAPTLITHGDVRALTQGPKTGISPDADSAGSFTPVLSDDDAGG